MNRYLAFAGDNRYPDGGMGDFLNAFDNLEDAKNSILDYLNPYQVWYSPWGHIYDTVNKEIVFKQ